MARFSGRIRVALLKSAPVFVEKWHLFASRYFSRTMQGGGGVMNRLHLQLALDRCTLPDACRMAALAAPQVDTIEVGTPLLMREGRQAISEIKAHIGEHPCSLFADTKISDEGASIARLCFEAGADAVSVVDGSSTENLQAVRAVADEFGKQVWVDLFNHSNPVVRARALTPYVDGFILHRTDRDLPFLLLEGLLAIDCPFRLAGGLTVESAARAAESQRATMFPLEGVIVGRAITDADDFQAALAAFVAICHPEGIPAPP
jgi:3-dehydro-L-gulonate-6-phosphate decarboxylase